MCALIIMVAVSGEMDDDGDEWMDDEMEGWMMMR